LIRVCLALNPPEDDVQNMVSLTTKFVASTELRYSLKADLIDFVTHTYFRLSLVEIWFLLMVLIIDKDKIAAKPIKAVLTSTSMSVNP